MIDHKCNALLGQLLVRAGILEAHIVEAAAESARAKELRLGQLLLIKGLVDEHVLKAALLAQRLIRQSILTLTLAVEAIKIVVAYQVDLNTALARLRWLNGHRQIHQVSRLVLDAGLVGLRELGTMLRISTATGVPIGRVFLVHGFINQEMRRNMLDALILVATGELTYRTAVVAVKLTNKTGSSLSDALGILSSPMTLLAFQFAESGLLTDLQIADVIEDSLQRETIWHRTSLLENLGANLRFAASVTLSRLVEEGVVSLARAEKLCTDLILPATFIMDRVYRRQSARKSAPMIA